MKYLKSYNESIRNLLKGKDLKDIKNNINYDSIVKYNLHEYFTDDELVNYIKIDHSLMYMVKQGLHFNKFGLIKYVIQNGFNINNLKEKLFIRLPKIKTTSNILECSISKNNDIKIIELLLDNGAKINDDCYVAANFYKRNDIVKLLNQYSKNNESIRHLLKGKDLNDILKNNKIKPLEKIVSGCQYGILSLVKDTIEDKEFDINDLEGFDFIIYSATINNHIDMVKYLLKNTNLDPTIYNNASIEYAYIENNVELVELLLNDDRVKNSLPKFKVNDYETLIYNSRTNESIRNLLKPINIDNLTDIQKFKISCKYDMETLFDETINKKISDDVLIDGFYDAAKNENINILNKLFNNKKFLILWIKIIK